MELNIISLAVGVPDYCGVHTDVVLRPRSFYDTVFRQRDKFTFTLLCLAYICRYTGQNEAWNFCKVLIPFRPYTTSI
jgi:NADH:ubiquinone oxidoreductase subunit E